MNKCQYCQKDTPNPWMYVALILPIEEMEEKIIKWNNIEPGIPWWEHLRNTGLSEKDQEELDTLNDYDQAVNTISKGYVCDDCLKLESELYKKYYPEELKI